MWSGNGCVVDCSLIPKSTGVSLSATACECFPGFYWNETNKTCWVNCSSVSSSTGVNINSSACSCNSTQYWSGTSCFLNCSNISYASASRDSNSCVCLRGYSWNQTQCSLNCSEKNHTSASASLPNGCGCGGGYLWVGLF